MATFNLLWDSTDVNNNATSTGQRVEYRPKLPPNGTFISNVPNITPTNGILPKNATTASVNTLSDNVVYQFQVVAICNTGTTSPNSNGVKEGINFACVTPTASTFTDTSITVVVSPLPADITAVVFNRGTGPISVPTSGGSASYTFTGLTPSTSYTITTQLKAVVDSVEITSALVNCSVTRATAAPSTCSAPTALSVTPAS